MLKHCRPDILTRGHLSLLHRDRVTFTGSIGTKFVGIKVNNYDLRGLAQSAGGRPLIDHFWYGAFIGSLWSSPYQNRLAGHRSSTTGWVKKMSPLTKYDTIAPILKINEIHLRDIDPDVHADTRYKNSIDRPRNVWVINAWKRRTSFAPTQGLNFSSLWNVLSDMSFHCFNEICRNCLVVIIHIFSFMWRNMWIAVSVFTWHITTNVQTLCWSKSSPSFSSAHSSCISRSINTIFVPHFGMYIRINMSETDFIYLKIWCDSVTFCQRGHFFYSPCRV